MNINNHIIFHTPLFLQNSFFVKFLSVLLFPVKELHNMFENYRRDSLYKTIHNSQIGSMRAMLNDYFDQPLRRIYIKNSELKIPTYFYDPLENKEVFFYQSLGETSPTVPFYDETIFYSNCDFTVFIPIELKPNNLTQETVFLDKIKAQVEYYKLYSKNYKLAYF